MVFTFSSANEMVDLKGMMRCTCSMRPFCGSRGSKQKKRAQSQEEEYSCPGGLVSGMGSPGLRSLLTSACLLFAAHTPHLPGPFFLLCWASSTSVQCLLFTCLWRVFSGHLLTCVLGQECLPVGAVFCLWNRLCTFPACVSWFTKMDILNRNDDSKLKTGYKCMCPSSVARGRKYYLKISGGEKC